jgi:hypothetical protein
MNGRRRGGVARARQQGWVLQMICVDGFAPAALQNESATGVPVVVSWHVTVRV